MKTKMQDTSLKAYQEIKPKLNEKQELVYRVLVKAEKSLTNSELACAIGWSINRVTGRMNELVNEKKLVVQDKKRMCSITGRTAIAWKIKEIVDDNGQRSFF